MQRWLDRVRLRLRSLVRGNDVDLALRSEIQTHLEEQIAENIRAGMTRVDARRTALRAFGPVASVEEACRDTRRVSFVQNVGRDLRYTLRSLARQPLLVIVAALSIGVGAAANAVIFSLATELLLAEPTTRQPERLAYIRTSSSSHVSYPQWRDLNESGALAGLAGFQIEVEVNWTGPDRSISLIPLVVTPNFFDLLGVPVTMGRAFTTEEARPEKQQDVVVISHGFWQNRLAADPAVVGRMLTFNGRPYTVLGVMPPGIRSVPGVGISPEVYLPISRHVMPDLDNRDASAVMLIGRLHDGQSYEQALAALQAAVAHIDQASGGNRLGGILRFAPVGGLSQVQGLAFGEIAIFFGVLWIAVGLVLAIACANVAGLLLSRSAARRREVSVRSALGASRGRLVQQFLVEAFWLALAGTSLGLLISRIVMESLSKIRLPLPIPLEIQSTLDIRLLGMSVCVLLVTTLLCGLMPALQVTRPSLVPGLKQDEPRYGHRRLTVRTLLVIGQVAVALVLLLTAFLFLRNLRRAQDLDPGFDVAHTLVAQTSFVEGRYTRDTRAFFLEDAAARLREVPGIRSASYSYGVPLTIRSGMTTGTELTRGDGTTVRAFYQSNFVGPEYFKAMGIRLIAGREFLAADRTGAPQVAIINEEFARRYLADRDPIGQQLFLPGARDQTYPVEIVGVVGNGKYRTIGEDQQAAIYEAFMQRSNRGRLVHVIVRADEASEAVAKNIERVLSGMDPSAAIDVTPMRSALAFTFLPSQIGAALLGALGALGLGLAMVGLYATIAYSVSRRTAEIGIRMALGASRRDVMRLVLRDAAILSAIGIVIGLALAFFVTRPLAMFLVAGLSAGDPMSFLATAALLFGISLAAAASPARRAMRIDPVTALRVE